MIGILVIPALIAAALNAFRKPADVTPGQHLAGELVAAGRHLAQAVFTLVCLPYEAFFSLDAMVRAGWRMLITHRQMLQWDSSGDMDGQGRTDLTTSWRTMWFAPLFSAAALSYLIVSRPAALGMAGPILGLWFCLSGHRLVDQSTVAPAPRKTDNGSDPLFAQAFPKNLDVFRNLRRPGRSLAAAG